MTQTEQVKIEANRPEDIQKKLVIITIESIAVFIITYLVISFFNNYISLYFAKTYRIIGELHYYGIRWITFTRSTLWSEQSVKMVFASGPIISLIFVGVIYQIFLKSRKWHYLIRLSMAWCLIHCFVSFFGAYIAGVFSRDGLWFASVWVNNKFAFEISMMLLCAFIAVMIGNFAMKMFLSAANSSTMVRSGIQKRYIVHQVVIPWIFGAILIFIFKLPRIKLYESIMLCTYVLFFISYLFMRKMPVPITDLVKIKKKYKLTGVKTWLFLLSIILLVVYRVILK